MPTGWDNLWRGHKSLLLQPGFYNAPENIEDTAHGIVQLIPDSNCYLCHGNQWFIIETMCHVKPHCSPRRSKPGSQKWQKQAGNFLWSAQACSNTSQSWCYCLQWWSPAAIYYCPNVPYNTRSMGVRIGSLSSIMSWYDTETSAMTIHTRTTEFDNNLFPVDMQKQFFFLSENQEFTFQ